MAKPPGIGAFAVLEHLQLTMSGASLTSEVSDLAVELEEHARYPCERLILSPYGVNGRNWGFLRRSDET